MGLKFKNIRVKMKGGKSRIQRAMVLASGKLRFVKNIHKSRSAAPKTKHTKRRNYQTARKKKGHGGGRSMTAGIEKAASGVTLFGPAALHVYQNRGDMGRAGVLILRDYSGINADHGGKWEPHNLVNGWGPYVGFQIARKVAHKVIGLIRRF